MAIKVNANVIDIRIDSPRSNDMFFVDTNVWYWVGYTNASIGDESNQSVNYPKYVGDALSAGSSLYRCTLSFAELAHSIERSERTIFEKSTGKQIKPKIFRHDYPNERANILTEIENTWVLSDGMTDGNTIEVDVSASMVSDTLTRLKSEGLDGYDAFMVEAILARGIKQVITDDADFGQISGITVFTANDFLIRQATKQGKIRRR
ncbi:MAG: hypothetical protein ACOYLB_01330 [Phototrophicaceae bacterium]